MIQIQNVPGGTDTSLDVILSAFERKMLCAPFVSVKELWIFRIKQ